MGVVTEHLLAKLRRQIEQDRVVLWYDPDKEYRAVADTLAADPALLPAKTHFARYEDSFYALRHTIEPLIDGLHPPRLLVYVPLSPEETQHALIEFETLGVTMRPGQPSAPRNTRLAVVAREALKDTLGEEAAQQISDQALQGKLTLAELDVLAERTEGLRGVLAAIYDGAMEPTALSLAFLTRPDMDTELVRREALGEMVTFLHDQTGFPETKPGDAETLRRQFARYLLLSDLSAAVSGALPSALATVTSATRETDRASCATLAQAFRLRRDLSAAYADLADTVARELNLARLANSLSLLPVVETFRETEQELQQRTETELLNASSATEIATAVERAQERLRGFWAEYHPAFQARWALIAVAGRLLWEADRIGAELKFLGATPKPAALLTNYTRKEAPWCTLDTHHRHLERRWINFDFEGDCDTLERLIARARQRYTEIAGALAESFARSYQRARFRPEATGVSLRQRDIFLQYVRPYLGATGEKVAYVLVDAMRYEMAQELAHLMKEDAAEIRFEMALGTVPTITEVGMAALMPGAEVEDIALVAGRSAGKLALQIEGKSLGSREERVQHLKDYLRAQHSIEALDLRLEDLLPRPTKRRETAIRQSGFLFVTSQEIDALCESGNIPLARRTMDEMLHQIRRMFRVLGDLGVTRIVCVADHGHLFAEELQEDMKIEAPGGETIDLHRRVWVGRGGATDEAYFRARAADFGFNGDLELAIPYGLACFKAPGAATAYFHGGISPQELSIPVLTVVLQRADTVQTAWNWMLKPGSTRITTRFFSVTVQGLAGAFFEAAPPRIRLELRAENRVLSMPVSASYGFEEGTGDIALLVKTEETIPGVAETQPNTIALMLTEEVNASTASLHLLDADTSVELARLEDLALSISL